MQEGKIQGMFFIDHKQVDTPRFHVFWFAMGKKKKSLDGDAHDLEPRGVDGACGLEEGVSGGHVLLGKGKVGGLDGALELTEESLGLLLKTKQNLMSEK